MIDSIEKCPLYNKETWECPICKCIHSNYVITTDDQRSYWKMLEDKKNKKEK